MEYQIKTHEEKPIPPAAVKHIYQAEKWWPERELDDIAKMLSQNKKQTYGILDDTRLI